MECRISTELEGRLRDGADARALGLAVATAWNGIVDNLHPVIGLRGVDSLTRRCMFLASVRHPWLAAAGGADRSSVPDGSLIEVLGRRTPAEAAAGGADLLRTMDELLTSLVGASLTRRLLQPVWNDFLRGTARQGGTS